MSAKSKINLNQVGMPKQLPEGRRHNFRDVTPGCSQGQAEDEASRCLQCGKPICV